MAADTVGYGGYGLRRIRIRHWWRLDAYNTFGGGGFGAGTILHNGYKAGAIGAGAYDGSPSSRTIYVGPGSNRWHARWHKRSRRHGAPVARAERRKANFVHTYASHTDRGNAGGTARTIVATAAAA